MTPSNPTPGEQQFRLEVQRLETERGLNNEQAYLMVAAAVLSHPVSHSDRDSITHAVHLFVATTVADAESLDAISKDQLARMKKHNILELHQSRMNTHIILSHFGSSSFE